MKKLALLIATSIAISVNAAPETRIVYGNIDNWQSWNASSKSPLPYATAVAGVDLAQADHAGDSILTAPTIGLHINLVGEMTFDNVTGVISALSLSQIGNWTGWYDTDSDSFADDSITISGLQWTLNTDSGYLSQTAGSASGCSSSSPICVFTVTGKIPMTMQIRMASLYLIFKA